MTMPDSHVTVLPDGRQLGWLEAGVADGPVVFGFHGTPGSRLQMLMAEAAVRAAGVRFIATDRPGYGMSTYHPRRRLADWASDVSFLADHLGVDRFSVIGVSGGGPHAVACARFLEGRVVAAGIVSGVAPLSEPGSEAEMMPANQRLTQLGRRSPTYIFPMLAVVGAFGRRWPERALEMLLKQLPEADAAVLARPEVREVFLQDLAQASPTSARAAAQDFGLFSKDWGFRLEDIAVPVHLWQGDADVNVPAAHAKVQAAAIPGAVLHEVPGEAHLLIVDHLEEILRTVTAAA